MSRLDDWMSGLMPFDCAAKVPPTEEEIRVYDRLKEIAVSSEIQISLLGEQPQYVHDEKLVKGSPADVERELLHYMQANDISIDMSKLAAHRSSMLDWDDPALEGYSTLSNTGSLDNGDCYEAAGKYLMDEHLTTGKSEMVLVHGRATLQRDPFSKYGHAWVEFVSESGILMTREVANGNSLEVPTWLYHRVGKIDPGECHRYTFEDMRGMITKYRHWGPWDDEYERETE